MTMRMSLRMTLRTCLLPIGVLVAAPGSAWAAGDGGGGVMDLVWQAVNLLLLIAVLVYFARKPLRTFFEDRRKQIKGELDDAASLLAQAEARYADWQRKLIDLDSDLAEVQAEGRRRADEERESILADAQAIADRIHRDAVAAVEQELRRAQAVLRNEAAELATEIAEQILREKLQSSDSDRLMDEFITRVEPANEPGRAS
jgi:F-type H+-transporting ATPase subunit b